MSTIMAQPPTVATAVADGLQAAGIDTVYGLPGGENVHLMEAMRQAGLRFVLSEHENAAVFMAAAASQLTRRPTVCLTTLGPGAVNCTAGVAHAFLDRCPVLVFTAQMAPSLQDRHTHQLVDLHRLFAPITKATLDVTPGRRGHGRPRCAAHRHRRDARSRASADSQRRGRTRVRRR